MLRSHVNDFPELPSKTSGAGQTPKMAQLRARVNKQACFISRREIKHLTQKTFFAAAAHRLTHEPDMAQGQPVFYSWKYEDAPSAAPAPPFAAMTSGVGCGCG